MVTDQLLISVPNHETVSDMEAAMRARFDDALVAWLEKRNMASVYLAGYAVECCLKVACFRRHSPGVESVSMLRGTYRPQMKASNLNADPHSLSSWFELSHLKMPFSPILHAQVSGELASVERHWDVGLRYYGHVPPDAVVEETIIATDVLLRCFPSMSK